MITLKNWTVRRAGAGMTIEGEVVQVEGKNEHLLGVDVKITRVITIERLGLKIIATREEGETNFAKVILE